MSKPTHQGELIRLEDYDGEWPIYGHVSDEEAVQVVLDRYEEDGDEPPRLGVVARWWARWGFSGASGPYRRLFLTYKEKGRGRFPFTMVADLDEWERDQARRAKEKARKDAIRAWLPEATDITLLQEDLVWIRLPMVGRVTWKWGEDFVTLTSDAMIEPWNYLYKGRKMPQETQ